MSAARVVTLAGAGVLALAATVITKWEGVHYEPYRDPVGIWTVCYGHTGPDVVPSKKYTQEDCDRLLAEDMAEARFHVNRCLPMPKLEQIEASLISATFNIGPKVVCESTLRKKALANDWPGACAELDRWKHAGGRVFRGLVLRRADERAMCEGKA